MSLIFATIPQKRLAQGITAASTSFSLNNVKSFDGENNVAASNLGTQHYCCFRNDTGTRIEIMEIDPSTIENTSITILRRGLSFYGDRTTENESLKLDWSANETIVQLGTDVPQIFQYLKEYIDAASIAGAVDASTTAKGIVEEATQAEVDARTETGGTGAKLFATPDKIRASKYHDYAADSGSTDAYAITVTPAPSAYVDGQVFVFKANTVNTGDCTLNVNSLGAKTIVKEKNVAMASGEIKAGQRVMVIYDGTNFQMLSAHTVVSKTKVFISTTGVTFTNGNGGSGAGAEQTVFSTTIAAGTLGTNNGVRFKSYISGAGIDSATAWEIRIKLGGTQVLTLQSNSSNDTTGMSGFLEGFIIANGATDAQKVSAVLFLSANKGETISDASVGVTKSFISSTATSTKDSTTDLTFEISAILGADSANDAVFEWLIVESII